MILIKNIEYIEVDRDPWEIISKRDPYQSVMVNYGAECIPESIECLTEFVHGRRFVNQSKGLDVVIGMTRDVQNLIGIQYEAWETQEEYITGLNTENQKLKHWRRTICSASFFTRLKWLFSGIDSQEK
jgi:hypothetical protein